MTIVESKGFGANAQIRASPLGASSSAVRALEKEDIAGIVDSDPLALGGVARFPCQAWSDVKNRAGTRTRA